MPISKKETDEGLNELFSDARQLKQDSGVLIKQVKPGRPRVFKTGRRKIRMKVGSWLHIALDGLNEAYPDSLTRRNILPPFSTIFGAKPLELLLRYGLIDHKLGGVYKINESGMRVLKELNNVMPIVTFDYLEWNDWRTWIETLGKERQYDAPKGYRFIMITIPGSTEWEEYFRWRVW